MTVCDGCNQLMDGLADYCQECLRENDEHKLDCNRCGGSGEIEWNDEACSVPSMIECYSCKGTGVPHD